MSEGAVEPGRRVKFEAEYATETEVCCPTCRSLIDTIGIVRLLRSHVNFTSTLPRRGYIAVCPMCRGVLPVDLGWM